MKVLIIEDNKTIANNIKKYLELSDFKVLIAENWLYGLEVARNNDFDIILLDLMLPWMSWEEICKTIKSEKDIPIIMTTAKWQLEDKLEWFELWADDYLVKPFDLEELEARIKVLTRRKQNKNKPIIKWNISIDIQNRKILKWDKEVKLTVKEYNILECLVKNIGMPLSRTDLIQEVRWWESIFEDDAKLDVYISTIRRKLGKDIIETVKWFGYRMNK
jgi:DNA-binding response OmpR family regulator